jgi:hypothetical protein
MTVLADTYGLGAGFVGFLVVLALGIAAVFLFRSMTKHLRRVPATFEEPPAAAETETETTGSGDDPDGSVVG